MRRARGSAFIAVLAVLALLAILMELALQLVTSHVSESRRRGDTAYAGELARSGLAWARACIASGAASCDGRLEVAGGEIAITTRRDGEEIEVTARGTVMRGKAEGPNREATTRVRPPEPSAAPPAPWPPVPTEPDTPRDPADPGLQPPTPAATPPAHVAPAPDPTSELEAVPHP